MVKQHTFQCKIIDFRIFPKKLRIFLQICAKWLDNNDFFEKWPEDSVQLYSLHPWFCRCTRGLNTGQQIKIWWPVFDPLEFWFIFPLISLFSWNLFINCCCNEILAFDNSLFLKPVPLQMDDRKLHSWWF